MGIVNVLKAEEVSESPSIVILHDGKEKIFLRNLKGFYHNSESYSLNIVKLKVKLKKRNVQANRW